MYCAYRYISSVVDLKRFSPVPDPTFQVVLDPDPDPTLETRPTLISDKF
jgi:hypothetical protein